MVGVDTVCLRQKKWEKESDHVIQNFIHNHNVPDNTVSCI